MRSREEERRKTAALKEERRLLVVNKGRWFKKIAFLLLAFCFFSAKTYSQCAMCRAALESEGNAQKAQGINDGIVYLMVIPYVLIGAIGYAVYRMNATKKK